MPRLRQSFMVTRLFLAAVSLFVLLSAAPPEAWASAPDACVVARIDAGASALAESLRAISAVDYWIEADRDLLLCSREGRSTAVSLASEVARRGGEVAAEFREVRAERLRLWRGGRQDAAAPLGRILASGGRWAVLELAPWVADLVPPEGSAEVTGASPSKIESRLFPFAPNRVLARRHQATRGSGSEGLTDPQLELVLGELDAGRWFGDIVTLAGWNRWTRGSQILTARDWLVAQLGALDRVTVTTASFPVPPSSTGWNVIATLPGTTRPDDWYVVGGHYDSTSENPASAAPGAEDNASGCAGVLELARILAAHPPDGTVFFVCFSGEEQGLDGSYDFVADLAAAGTLSRVLGAFIMDMIGFTEDADLDCLLETDPLGQGWMNAFASSAADFTTLSIVTSLNAWGSDHVPFLEEGRPAVLAIENDWDSYPHYHKTTDLPANITQEMGLQILRMGAAGLLRQAGTSMVFADGFESAGTERWSSASP